MSKASSEPNDSNIIPESWTGAEPFIVGLAPTYWAHVPMFVADILNLEFVDGIDCWIPNNKQSTKVVPVSKCVLIGHIICKQIQSDDCCQYVLDDGTGLIDCRHFVTRANGGRDSFALPQLVSTDPLNTGSNSTKNYHDEEEPFFQIGDLVRVFGRIGCLGKATKHEGDVDVDHEDSHSSASWIREIRVSLIESVEHPGFSPGQSFDAESRHWATCISRHQSASVDPSNFNALGILKSLGRDIQSQVKEKEQHPANYDRLGAWRVFGLSCSCQLEYMEKLLYCHCQAELVSLDPKFSFRDALLKELLLMEEQKGKILGFTYNKIKANKILCELATELMKRFATEPGQLIPIERIFLPTIRALRNDGILHLIDEKLDRFMLISRKYVLEPYITHQISTRKLSKSSNYININGVPYFSKKHFHRLKYVQCSLDVRNEG